MGFVLPVNLPRLLGLGFGREFLKPVPGPSIFQDHTPPSPGPSRALFSSRPAGPPGGGGGVCEKFPALEKGRHRCGAVLIVGCGLYLLLSRAEGSSPRMAGAVGISLEHLRGVPPENCRAQETGYCQ